MRDSLWTSHRANDGIDQFSDRRVARIADDCLFWHARRMTVALKSTSTGIILYDSEHVPNPSMDMFDARWWAQRSGIVARASGRGAAIFVRDGERHWVVRHYRRGGLVAKVLTDVYCWRGLERTRAVREWRLLHALHGKGLPVPVPVAAGIVRSGLWYRADLITVALPPSRTLADSITGARLDERTWRSVGATIAKFHGVGVQHADLNAHNILLGEGGQVFVLDFDRGRIRPRGTWEQRVLARLQRSLRKIRRQRANVQFDERDWQELIAGYRREIQDSGRGSH